ncbi:ubiquitin-associated protein 1 [Athalia rosae]|uniref:ubiquitin-associated protein 1 n=1 Tax=Athalia rosae TaxID=37344 RepID=UPI002034747D|nr:ubiquitin-associated protein 1 [Athalia rosae]
MSRPTISAQCDSVASYMDGVHVKIAEAYKPPRKIALPVAYNNKLPDVSKYTYDFSLEKVVIDKMTEWRKARTVMNEARLARLIEKKKKENEETPPLPAQSDPVNQSSVKVAPAPETTILTPQPLSPPPNELLQYITTSNGLDLADFDNDTSSPFDNMELKTINDMEELAQVLQPSSRWVTPPIKLESILTELTLDPVDQSEGNKEHKKSEADENTENDKHTNSNHPSIPTIVQELQRELARPIMENWKPWPDLESPNCDTDPSSSKFSTSPSSTHSGLSNPLPDLSEDDQKLAKHLSDMGFPLARAARAIRDLGGHDNKKVVEYLLAIQSLEEFGIPGDDAEKVLALTEYDQEKAKLYYQNLRTLRDLGFPEDQASSALLRCNIDRDQALDFLIA